MYLLLFFKCVYLCLVFHVALCFLSPLSLICYYEFNLASSCSFSPHPQPSYLLLAPRVLRPRVPLSLSVTILTSSPVTVSAQIVHGTQTVASISVTVTGGKVFVSHQQNYILKSTSSYSYPYSLEVKGHMGSIQVFANSTKLLFNPKGLSTFIQTDKQAYHPGQMVKIRAVSIHPDGKPYISPVNITIKDPRGNLLRQWLAADSVLGVVSREFELSDNPPLGEWTIVTTVSVSLTYNSTVNVAVATHRYKLSFDNYPRILRPSMNFIARVRKHFHRCTLRYLSCFLRCNASCFFRSEMFYSIRPGILNNAFCLFCVKVMSRGQVLSAGSSSGDLTLVPEISWAPLACIIVYCVQPQGEIINDMLQLPIRQTLQNQVSLSWSSTVKTPGDEVTLTVRVEEPGSLVGILVVDKMTQRMGSSNDITPERQEMHPLHQTNMEPQECWDFPETWIWMDTNISNSGTAEIELNVPDSITTWTATAFVMSENLGLGLVEWPAMVFASLQLLFSQIFFVFLNLPASIIRGEVLLLEVFVFSHFPQDLEVMVIVDQSDTFEFISPDNQELFMPGIRWVSVGSGSGASVLIPIKPLVLGEMPISVEAVSSDVSDTVHKTLLVKAEGLEQSFSTSLLFEVLPPNLSLSKYVLFTFPPDVVEGSVRASVTAVGDILGPSISGLDSLIQMPCGCGEQNMINFAPNIYILNYLNATGQASETITDKAKDYMMKGYERELSYQRPDGSFSAFGEQDSSGSTWLTAFVLRCFLQARPFISIDTHVLNKAVAWLVAQQGPDGRFREPGRVIHTELQGGLDGPVSFTAYVLMYRSQVSSALKFLETQLALGVSSNYSLCLLTYALVLSGSPSATTALNTVITEKGNAPLSSSYGGLSSSWQPRCADIEMASYILLSQYKLGNIAEGLSLMKWLSLQRTHLGGYGSTQLNVFYNIRNNELTERRRRDVSEREAFHLEVKLLSKGLGLNATGMAIIEVGLLSCFSLAPDGIQTNTYLKNVETKPELVILYLDSVSFTETNCKTDVPLVMYCKVAQGQKASVVIYDYYEPSKESQWRSSMSTCSFCGEDCSECRQNDYSVFSTSSHSSQQFLPTTLLFALLVLLRIMI
uniref:Uncharacterized protein n=1 Tax=Monopterus albus TaxID=43700 RepID=A0A3Q3JNE8_MONAL